MLPSKKSRKDWVYIFAEHCNILRNRSVCLKYQTAAVITRGTQIVATGYNGTISGASECCDVWEEYYNKSVNKDTYKTFIQWVSSTDFKDKHREWSILNESHAETNALNWIAKGDIDDTYALYTYYSPCENCAKNIISYGIKKVYYLHLYPSGSDALKFLQDNKIECIHV